MKRFLLAGITFFLMLTLAGCRQHDGMPVTSGAEETTYAEHKSEETSTIDCIDWVVDALEFASLEALREGYQSAKPDRYGKDLMQLAESVNFAALEKVYVPIGVPETYQFHKYERIL